MRWNETMKRETKTETKTFPIWQSRPPVLVAKKAPLAGLPLDLLFLLLLPPLLLPLPLVVPFHDKKTRESEECC